MKKTLMIVCCLFMSYFAMAQEPVKQKEIGLVFSDLNNFGLSYKTGTENSLWRFNSTYFWGGVSKESYENEERKRSNVGFGFNIGKEYRKALANDIEFRYGADLSFGFGHNKNEYYNRSETRFHPGINLVFGLNYKFSDKFVLGAELLPGFSYTTGSNVETINNQEVKTEISGFSYGLSNASALLSLSYRF